MAESMLIAFGRYLRLLRERRGLSLEEVTALTRSYPDPVSKSYLSRVEHGQCRIGFSKMIALARAYEVPIEAVAERLSLDLEVDKLEMPKTDGLDFDERIELANKAIRSGKHWVGYAVARDAAIYADQASKPASFFAGDALSNAATASAACARGLGKYHYALHEFTHLKDVAGNDPKTRIAALQQLASLWSLLGRPDTAETLAETAVELARSNEFSSLLAYSLESLGNARYLRGDLGGALSAYRESIRLFREQGADGASAHALVNLAQVYFAQRRNRAAKSSLRVAEQTHRRMDQLLEIVRIKILMGEIAVTERSHNEAKRAFREAIDISRRLGAKNWLFKGEYLLYQVARSEGDEELSSSLRRRLSRLAPAVAGELDELKQFRAEIAAAR